MDACAIGIDLGGTNCRGGVVGADGTLLAQRALAVGNRRSEEAIVALLTELIEALSSDSGANGASITVVGVGAPGLVSHEEGVIYQCPHYPWRSFPLSRLLQERVGLPVVIDNDANCIALGEARYGAARGDRNFWMVTFGTGIGGGLVHGGELWRGDRGLAGEVGHFVIDKNGPPCECGGAGCWELYASIRGIRRIVAETDTATLAALLAKAGETLNALTPERVARLADEGDPVARKVWADFGAMVGVGIASLVNITGIETFVIGGGLAAVWNHFIGAARTTLTEHIYSTIAPRVVMKRAGLGDAAGILGAAAMAARKDGGR
ncbi:MAG: ROK family protein [Deltaproteobacteria bacterium]|nr:ROK family protein [Deltaproteobacteria bacterium]